MLNSAYGAIGCSYFRHYCYDEATAITISGQACLKWVSRRLNEYFNKVIGTEDSDYVKYGDTDSVYLDFTPLVDKFLHDKSTDKEILNAVQKIADEKINKVIEDAYTEFAEKTNVFENHIDMKREAIGSSILIKKKKYVMYVYDSEGVRYSEPDLYIKGLEAVRSSIPQWCRNNMKKTIEMIFTTDELTVAEHIDKLRVEFMTLPFDMITQPTGCNGLSEYDNGTFQFMKGTPYHVKAALSFNMLLEKHGLTNKYQKIQEGEKVKVVALMLPNPVMIPTIGFPEKLPPEFGLIDYIDKEVQFEKTFLEPMKRVLDVMGWRSDNNVRIDDFF